MSAVDVIHGDCTAIMADLEPASFHAVVTDPPYELGFMGKKWDSTGVAFDPATWRAVLRVMKPGAHLLAFGGTRTYHRMVVAIEDAGFEIRDAFLWLYGSGMPHSHNVAKAIDKSLGKVGEYVPATAEAAEWNGWGTAVKPAVELICLARKPLCGTVAANVLAYGCGGINIDACRISTDEDQGRIRGTFPHSDDKWGNGRLARTEGSPLGRWPANVSHDGSAEVEEAFARFDAPGQQRSVGPQHGAKSSVHTYGDYGARQQFNPRLDAGTAARFFYSSKADKADRAGSKHPTVKPVDLIRHYVRLVTPLGGRILDPFAGSGTTGEAAMLEGFDATLIEMDAQHVADIRHRVKRWAGVDLPLFGEQRSAP